VVHAAIFGQREGREMKNDVMMGKKAFRGNDRLCEMRKLEKVQEKIFNSLKSA
jgi:hypothetical protein